MKITSEDVLNIGFSGALFGYDRKEVDEFLDAAAEQMRELEREKEEMSLALDTLMKQIEQINAQKEEQEKDAQAIRKNTQQREKKMPANARERKQEKRSESAEQREKEDEPAESAAPSRHIHRGTGERSKRSTSVFLRPKPFEENSGDAAETGKEQEPVPSETENEPAGGANETIEAKGSACSGVTLVETGDPENGETSKKEENGSAETAPAAETEAARNDDEPEENV